jgi:hypothetical protein
MRSKIRDSKYYGKPQIVLNSAYTVCFSYTYVLVIKLVYKSGSVKE